MTRTTPAPLTDDHDLAARAGAGERAAFEELHRRHHARMRRVAVRVLRDPHEAEDAVQEAWIRAGARIGTCDEPLAWLITVTRNEALRMLQRRGRIPCRSPASPSGPTTAPTPSRTPRPPRPAARCARRSPRCPAPTARLRGANSRGSAPARWPMPSASPPARRACACTARRMLGECLEAAERAA